MNLENIRREYLSGGLSKKNMPQNPFDKIQKWIAEAIEKKVLEPTAIILSTVSNNGTPSSRTVLLKELLNDEFVFYSNYNSRKGINMAENNNVSLLFLWHELERQIHIEGTVRKIDSNISDEYFSTRPYTSKIGARISKQSNLIPSRSFIMAKFVAESSKFIGRDVPRPDYWGGYAVKPQRIEFWQGRKSRLHDRFLYELTNNNDWSMERLSP